MGDGGMGSLRLHWMDLKEQEAKWEARDKLPGTDERLSLEVTLLGTGLVRYKERRGTLGICN